MEISRVVSKREFKKEKFKEKKNEIKIEKEKKIGFFLAGGGMLAHSQLFKMY